MRTGALATVAGQSGDSPSALPDRNTGRARGGTGAGGGAGPGAVVLYVSGGARTLGPRVSAIVRLLLGVEDRIEDATIPAQVTARYVGGKVMLAIQEDAGMIVLDTGRGKPETTGSN